MNKITVLANLVSLFGLLQLPANAVQLVVPAYFAPSPTGLPPASTPNGTADWNTLIAAQQAQRASNQLPIVAIVNPNTGAGTAGDRAYYQQVYTDFANAGGTLIGYVPSGYVGQLINPTASCQPSTVQTVVSCAQAYQTLYPNIISGIFVDEFGIQAGTNPHLTATQVKDFYTQIYNGIKGIDANWTVFGNPGSNAPIDFLRQGNSGGANTLITYEDTGANYPANRPSDYVNSFPSSTFGNFVLQAPESSLQSIINTAVSRNVGYIFVTDDGADGNPYDRLPTYFANELSIINNISQARPVAQQVPEPDTWPMPIVGVGAILAIRYRKRAGVKG
ncbi:spherulation-specific family 4 protein [Chamaesiphon sp. GL140_3_metabinner_50]|uniref:spherulation-specific family 4 protein n=1 Tax=Chamaesiphon sp. GL140_3_metabinner_50 TaxID=2970812 RepID=UPI0025FCF405|nr:spherulation-specific family 4 protein [Chamaesiphon sp. GL140_3_metabinner_50]